MGRLPALIVVLGLAACDKSDPAKTTSTTSGRSEVVHATGNMATAAPAPTPTPTHAAPATPRKLCDADATVRTLPKGSLARAQVSGATPLDDKIPTGGGKFTWLNFFAAWCGPCKEEIPRLRTWEKKLADAGTPVNLVFVSLDDDDRQLSKFLEAQPPTGVKAALWLKSGGMRDGWLASMRMKNPPDLPEHALIDPSGKVSCIIEGALDDVDYPQFAAYVGRR
jgi:thiol-disulfide isomerase/thioredoxin